MGIRILDFADGFSSASSPSETGGTIVVATQAISASGTITLDSSLDQILKVQGDGAPVTASSTPFGTTPPSTGTVIVVSGADDTNTVTLEHNDSTNGCILNGDATLGAYDAITLVYNSASERYEELSRNF